MLGFIFQQYNLLPKLNLVENVEMPLMYAGVSRAERRKRAEKSLQRVGLLEKSQTSAESAFGRTAAEGFHSKRALVAGNPSVISCR